MKGGEHMAKKMSAFEKKDKMMDKVQGIKENSKKDKAMDAKAMKKPKSKAATTGGMKSKTMGGSIMKY